MKNVSVMIGEHKFVVDRVLASLALVQRKSWKSTVVMNLYGWVKCYLVAVKVIRLADKTVEPHTSSFPR